MTWTLDNLGLIGDLALAHLRQSLLALLLGAALALPLGWLAWSRPRLRSVLVTGTGLLYTIPSLALLLILPIVVGFPATSEVNLVIALAIYVVAIMVRSVVDGLDSVDDDVRASARAMGYGSRRRFFTVDLPLALPPILAGLRVATVSTVSLATVGILVGVTNLGYLFTNGLQRRITEEVLAGIVVVAAIALILDLILALLGRRLMPWSRVAS